MNQFSVEFRSQARGDNLKSKRFIVGPTYALIERGIFIPFMRVLSQGQGMMAKFFRLIFDHDVLRRIASYELDSSTGVTSLLG
jgi:hypothetical protein